MNKWCIFFVLKYILNMSYIIYLEHLTLFDIPTSLMTKGLCSRVMLATFLVYMEDLASLSNTFEPKQNDMKI